MRALITRPREDSAAIAERLEELGIEPLIEPLMTVEPVADAEVDLDGVQAILLTSRNGARALAGATERRDVAVYAVGDSTAELARESGFKVVESAGGDSDSLAALVRERLKPEDGKLLHAAGAAVAGDLAGMLAGDGFEVRRHELYATRPVAALSVATCGLLSDGGIDLVLFFSPRTAQTFVGLINHAGLADSCARVTAVCLSRAVASSIDALEWREVHIAERPNLGSMIEVAASAGASPEAQPPEARPDADDGATIPPPSPFAGATGAAANRQPWGAGAERSRPKRRAGAWVAAVAVVAILGAAGIYAWPQLAVWLGRNSGAVVADDGAAAGARRAMAGRVARLEDEVRSLRSGPLARLEAASGEAADELPRIAARLDAAERARAAGASADRSAIGARIEAIEKSVAELRAELRTVLAARIDGLETRISGLASGAADGIAGTARRRAEKDRLESDLTAMSRRIETLEAAASRPESADGPARGSALVLAVGQLRQALGKAGPFPGALESLRAIGRDDPVVARALRVLGPHAATGVPTGSRLIAMFDAAAAAASRAALAPEGSGWIDRTMQRLASVVTVRREGADVAGDSAQAVLARAEARLAAGDLEGADKELAGLSNAPAAAMAAWRASAASRIAADGALDRLSRHALQLVAGDR